MPLRYGHQICQRHSSAISQWIQMIRGSKFAENSWLFIKYKRDTKNPWVTRDNPYLQLGFEREQALRVRLSRCREQSWVVGKGQGAPGVMYNQTESIIGVKLSQTINIHKKKKNTQGSSPLLLLLLLPSLPLSLSPISDGDVLLAKFLLSLLLMLHHVNFKLRKKQVHACIICLI